MVFLLVVFFMLSTTFSIHETMEISMPSIGEAPSKQEANTLKLYVSEDGQVFWEDADKPERNLPGRLEALFLKEPDVNVIIYGSKRISVQELVAVMDEIYLAGGKRLALADWKGPIDYMPVIQIEEEAGDAGARATQ
jgi:biopolymer transport protein ExbD